MAMKILVTGATGFVGGALVRALHQMGYEVLASGRSQDLADVPFKFADLRDPGQARALCQGCDIVVHSAALSTPWGRPADFLQNNVVATHNLVQASHGVKRFIYLSSAGVYFRGDHGLNLKEDALLPTGGQHPYVHSKRLAEEVVRQSDIPFLIIRPRAVYGPGDTAIFPRLLKLLDKGRLPVIAERLPVWASLTHVDNLVQALTLSLEGRPGTYNISDGPPVDLWELIGWIARHLGLPTPRHRLPYPIAHCLAAALELAYPGEPPLTRYTLSLLAKSQTLDITKAARELGYRPLFGSWEGVARTLPKLRDHGRVGMA